MQLKPLPTGRMSTKYRQAAIRVDERQLLITDLRGSEQEKDLSEPVNCNGLGRVRHFRRGASSGWPMNPLPIDPACTVLGLPDTNVLRAQVFQNAVCNWRCWYCFVDFELLAASRTRSSWITAEELVDLYLAQPDPPPMIDLTGGQPDLTPEWVPWMMSALRARGLDRSVYLWSDDNLSNDYFWRYLTDSDRRSIEDYPAYGRVCCFKGITPEAFTFNTMAEPILFDQQFELFHRLLGLRLDLYAYVTLTTPNGSNIERDVATFLDRLQQIDAQLPLRTIPLKIQIFSPVAGRMNDARHHSLVHQQTAIEAWVRELEHRFTPTEIGSRITDIPYRRQNASLP